MARPLLQCRGMAHHNGKDSLDRAMAALARSMRALAKAQAKTEAKHVEFEAKHAEHEAKHLELEERHVELEAKLTRDLGDIRDDVRLLTRIVVRRFGTSGSASPIVGDHVLYRAPSGMWLPAVVVEVHSDETLALEVFGVRSADDVRYPGAATSGEGPGCWRMPG